MARLLQSGILTALWILLAASVYALFSSTDAFAQFIIAGIIPGTNYQLGFWQMTGLLALPLSAITYWLNVLRYQMAEHLLAMAQVDELRTTAAQQNSPTDRLLDGRPTLEIDELDAISI